MEEKSFLPSRRFVLSVILIVLVASAGYYSYNRFWKNEPDAETVVEIPNSGSEDDFDSDGLKNWEEFLWKTNPLNPDSDNDTTSDGEEVSLGRDPLKAGPDDSVSASLATEISANTTENFAQTFTLEYFGLKNSETPLSTADQEALIRDLVSGNISTPTRATYSITDIKVGNVSSTLALYKYGNDLGRAIQESTPPNLESELDIFQQAVTSGNRGIERLDKNIGGYKILVEKTLAIEVPASGKEYHLNIVNSLHYILVNLEKMRNVEIDPLAALVGLNEYVDGVDLLAIALSDLQKFLKENNVVYQQNEFGAIVYGI